MSQFVSSWLASSEHSNVKCFDRDKIREQAFQLFVYLLVHPHKDTGIGISQNWIIMMHLSSGFLEDFQNYTDLSQQWGHYHYRPKQGVTDWPRGITPGGRRSLLPGIEINQLCYNDLS